MTPYATKLAAYVAANTPRGIDAESWLDANVRKGWRDFAGQPEVGTLIVDDGDDDENQE